MKLTVIIPTYNEAAVIEQTITHLKAGRNNIAEIIVVDGGSTDATVTKAKSVGASVIVSPRKGRAAQMNFGAEHAKGEVLYFLHADSLPPQNFTAKISLALRSRHHAGCFQLKFDHNHFLLKTYAWFTRFDVDAFRFGDQSLFIMRDAFFKAGGFREDHLVMEDQEMVKRIKQQFSFAVLDEPVITSARKYEQVGFLKLQFIFVLVFVLYHFGVDQTKLTMIYQKLVQ